MHSEYIIRILLEEPGAATEDVRVEGADALIGSASHCHIRLSPDKVAPEQLRFEVRDGALFAEIRAHRPPALLNGESFRRASVPEGAVVRIGALEFHPSLERSRSADAARSGARSRSVFVASGVLLVVAMLLVAVGSRRNRAEIVAPAPPALFAELDDACPESTPEPAHAAATELFRRADAKRERAPFVPDEGLSAVALYRRAARCWEHAGDAREAEAVRARATKLQASVERDYHLHQVRVYLARRSQDSALLAREARVLGNYLKGRGGEYSAWLDQLQREIEAGATTGRVKR